MSDVIKREQAKRDLEECFVYLAEENLDVAVHFLVQTEETFELLAKMQFLGTPRDFRSHRLRTLRMWHVKSFEDYLIFYRPIDDGVEIFRVLYGKRDIEAIFYDED